MGDLIEELYRVFPACKKLPQQLDACTHCCMSQANHDRLRQMDRQFISPQLLYEYNTAAKKPNREESDPCEFKHFLPRMLELVWEGHEIHHSDEVTFARYSKLLKSDWTNTEIENLQEFAQSLLQKQCHFVETAFLLSDTFLMLTYFPIDHSELLTTWLGECSILRLHQLKYVLEFEYDFSKGKLKNSFAEDRQNTIFNLWLKNPDVLIVIRSAIERHILQDNWDSELDMLYDWVTAFQM